MKCPGQDNRYWKPEDVFEVPCPACGREVEFFKDDTLRRCPRCAHQFKNPRLDMGCLEWCPYAAECLAAGGSFLPPGRKLRKRTKQNKETT